MKLVNNVETKTWGELLKYTEIGDATIFCDECHKPITCEQGEFPGIILLGNVYVVGKNLGGIIGNNFPCWSDENQPKPKAEDLGKEFKFSWLDIRPVAYHVSCLKEIIDNAFDSEK
jgi:hypothetical protein